MKRLIPDRKTRNKEVSRATKFLFAQLNKGYNPEEAFQQVENSYGLFILECVRWNLQEYYKTK